MSGNRAEVCGALERYASATLDQTRQAVVCNDLHPVEERLARWLLMARDRSEEDTLFTDAGIYGAHARGATGERADGGGHAAASWSHPEHLWPNSSARPTGLEAVACGCYSIVRDCVEEVFTVS